MAHFEGQSVALPLRAEPDGVPIEWPEEFRPPSLVRWYALAGFAIVGATTILIGSGVGDKPAHIASAVPDTDTVAPSVVATDASAPPLIPRTTYAVPIDGLPTLGRAGAKVTLVVATEYACTGCEAARERLAGLRASYGDELRIVYKPFATARTTPTLQAACAAAHQGEFERFDAAVWRVGVERSRSLGIAITLPDPDQLHAIARDLGLDLGRFASDLERCAITVRNSRRELDALHVAAPAYFVNGRMVEGDALEALPALIEGELATATRRIREGANRERYYQEWVLDLGRTTR
jgi:protein-disulfide isomerase